MEFPKRIHVVAGEETESGTIPMVAAEEVDGIHQDLLYDGAQVAVYRLVRVKRVEVTRRLVKVNPADPDDGDEAEPLLDQLSIPLTTSQA